MKNEKIRIGAYIMVHNMAPLISACVNSLSWVDSIFLFDDNSTDGSLDVALKYAKCPIYHEKSIYPQLSFKKGELEVRNYLIDKAFEKLNVDILIILDADEMLSKEIKPIIVQSFSNGDIDSLCFSIWHLYDKERYLHFWETKINDVELIDPHTRIIRRGKYFTPLFEDGSHPILEPTKKTICVHTPYHFHLKYYNQSKMPNYSLFFLPERITEKDALPYLRNLPFKLPEDILISLSLIDWKSMPYYKETPHHSNNRVIFKDSKEALIHPKDRK